MDKYGIESRLTFSNSLIKREDLSNRKSNIVLDRFKGNGNGVIIYSDLLLDYISKNYFGYHFISSTTKVLTEKEELLNEIRNEKYKCVVPDFRFNNDFEFLKTLNDDERCKLEFLCNECCDVACSKRKECYIAVSRINMGLEGRHKCTAPSNEKGYVFSKAMESSAFIGIEDIKTKYLPLGFTNFKIEGRSLGSALLLEFILYYMTKPECVLKVREAIYLDNSLDLF